MKPITLTAIPCPYGALDHEGRAQLVVAVHDAPGTFLGATVDHEASAATKKTRFVIKEEPVEIVCRDIPALAYYVRRIQDGDLIPCDEATAKRAGLPYRPPLLVIAERKKAAVATWVDQHGEPPPWATTPPSALTKRQEPAAGEGR